MRNLILLITLSLLAFSCGKSNLPKKTFRYVGYIYNSNDSTPFRNTKFKVFSEGIVTKQGDEKTHLFTTDSNGYFDVTPEFIGYVCWPSYYYGSGYLGPQPFYSKDDSTNQTINQVVSIYKVYTEPFY